MAVSKKAAARLETEIEKYRVECNWEKVSELIKNTKSKTPPLESLTHLALGESELELYLLQNPPGKTLSKDASKQLASAKHHLHLAAKSGSKHVLRIDAQLLLAKLDYTLGEYGDVLKLFDKIHLDEISKSSMSCTRLKAVAEAFAIKGMCKEQMLSAIEDTSQKEKLKEEIVQCFEKAGDMALLYLQEVDKGRGAGSVLSSTSSLGGGGNLVGPVLETAVQRAPLIHIQEGKLDKGIGRFRQILKAVEARTSQGIRTTMARELAEVLLRGVCKNRYTPPPIEKEVEKEEKSSTPSSLPRGPGSASLSSLKPVSSRSSFKPKMYTTESLFVPKNVEEEALLLLLISELQVNRDVVLSRSKEHAQSREHSFLHATAVYDLLAITLSRRVQFSMLADFLDGTMKFSYQEFHMWYQFALALISAGRHTRALLVLRECATMQPENGPVLLQATKICLEKLNMINEGIEFAEKAVALGEGSPFIAKSYLWLGVGYSLKANETSIHTERQELQKKALKALEKSNSLDAGDFLVLYHIAWQLAISRQIPEAVLKVREALRLNGEHIPSLHLLALLLSAQKQYIEALGLIEVACNQYPDSMSLMFTKVKLEELQSGPEEALMTCKQMLSTWKETYDAMQSEESSRGTGLLDVVMSDRRSLAQMHLSEYSDRDSVSNAAILGGTWKSSIHNSIAASRVEHALSEVASSEGSSIPKQGRSQQIWMMQAHIWLAIAELYLSLEKPNEARACVQEASLLFPLSHHILFVRGCIHEYNQDFAEAKTCYDSALAINPSHIKSMQSLGAVLLSLEQYEMAEKVLRDAVNIDPTAHMAWINLGKVLEAQGEFESASDCLLTGLQLESTCPVQPFTTAGKLA
ncbi:tetratricopeptide repeat protein 7B-like isoform X2 [Acanthaster planci]|uniref:Tetratricopeptide repeat protein 7B-like isoform X2 n=1 Tax=Acanthaster planci TaxID=133434 RepID=A0A8B7ZGV5_ACAPL|nr:tetratricopeptide repeat protein 7B-like isoform X2 [Acanthaster planci]